MRQSGANQTAIRVISSMATRHMLADLASRFETATSRPVFVESVGGVDADNIGQWIAAGAEGVALGGGLYKPGSNAGEVRERAERVLAALTR